MDDNTKRDSEEVSAAPKKNNEPPQNVELKQGLSDKNEKKEDSSNENVVSAAAKKARTSSGHVHKKPTPSGHVHKNSTQTKKTQVRITEEALKTPKSSERKKPENPKDDFEESQPLNARNAGDGNSLLFKTLDLGFSLSKKFLRGVKGGLENLVDNDEETLFAKEFLQQAEEGKKEIIEFFSREIRNIIVSNQVAAEIRRYIKSLEFNVKIKVRVIERLDEHGTPRLELDVGKPEFEMCQKKEETSEK